MKQGSFATNLKAPMKRFSSLLSLLFLFTITNTINIAITIDDYPLPNGKLFTIQERTQRFIETCAQFNCKSVFFCVGQHCLDRNDPSLFEQLGKNGHFIANHSMNHRRSSSLSTQEFVKEIADAEEILKESSAYHKWFRYPYLDYGYQALLGGSAEKLKKFYAELQKMGYTEGYVTINTYDWYINKRLQDAIKANKQIDYEKLKTTYISLLEEWIDYYIKLYQQVTDKEITHTLLLHDNDLNALYLPDILAMIQNRGWNIMSPEEAFADTSWRKELLNKFAVIKQKPASLHEGEIDKQLAQSGAIAYDSALLNKKTALLALLAVTGLSLACYAVIRKFKK